MGPDPKILDDLARMAGGAVNIASGLQQQIRDDIRARVEEVADRLDLVPRADFEQAEDMIKKLRMQQDDMEQRIAALEAQRTSKTAKKTTKKTAKKTGTKAKK